MKDSGWLSYFRGVKEDESDHLFLTYDHFCEIQDEEVW